MSASSLSLPIFLRINFLISYLIVTDSQNTFDWHTQRALLNDKKAGAGCTSRAFKHPGRDVTAPDVWPSILTDYTYDSELDNADGVPLAFRRSSMFPEGKYNFFLNIFFGSNFFEFFWKTCSVYYFINNLHILFNDASVCTFLSSLSQWCMNVENHNESYIVCFEQLYLMIVLTTKQWNYGILCVSDLK